MNVRPSVDVDTVKPLRREPPWCQAILTPHTAVEASVPSTDDGKPGLDQRVDSAPSTTFVAGFPASSALARTAVGATSVGVPSQDGAGGGGVGEPVGEGVGVGGGVA